MAGRAIALYAEGWVAQIPLADRAAQEQIRVEVRSRMVAEMERRLATQGYYVPFGSVRIVIARKVRLRRR